MGRYRVLESISSPEDMAGLDLAALRRYCAELRHFLITNVSNTGGHLASNLGVVELTVALHQVFHSPVDQFVWDVGHQCYVHKIITGRRERMASLRQKDGLSGFPHRSESVHDPFISGHSTTSISVAEGLAVAKTLKGEEGHVVAVIGDGAFTGGMAFEGMNNIADRERLVVVLNDNKMSISKNVGRFTAYLTKLRSNRSYFRWKDWTKSALNAIPLVGGSAVGAVSRSKSYLKNALYNTSFFEDLGFVYMGPVDGHDLATLGNVLARAKSLNRPVFVHVETTKGKGYGLAEKNPGAYHGVAHFDPEMGNGDGMAGEDSFSDVMGSHLTALARSDSSVCAVTAAMKYATGLHHFSKEFKEQGRFFDVGIAEQHAVTFSAALASQGMKPVFAVYSSFLQRAYDQILHDSSIEAQHLVLAVDRAGLVGADGETHQGIFDCAYLRTIPGVTIWSPATYRELKQALDQAVLREEGVCAVRYPRGGEPDLPVALETEGLGESGYHLFGDGEKKLLLVTYGRQFAPVSRAAARLREQGVSCAVLKLDQVWPLPQEAVKAAGTYDRVLFAEEGIRGGGIGEAFAAALLESGAPSRCEIRAIMGHVPHATVDEQLHMLGLDEDSLVRWAMLCHST